MKKLLLLIMGVAMIGCATGPITKMAKNNNAKMAKLSLRMTKAQVIELMGPAQKTEAYETKTGGTLEYLLYITQAEFEVNWTDKHFTPLCFIDGKLKGWGRNFYDDTIKIRKEIIRKP